MDRTNSSLEYVRINGLVVQVKPESNYAVVHAMQLGWVLLSPFTQDLGVELGLWYSVAVGENTVEERLCQQTGCSFSVTSVPKPAKDVFPTAVRDTVDGKYVVLRLGALVGVITAECGVALSQMGRIFLCERICKERMLSSSEWVICDVRSIRPSEANRACYWFAESVVSLHHSEENSLRPNIRLREGYFEEFIDRHQCILRLCDRDGGFVRVHWTDFRRDVSAKRIKEAKLIEVYACETVSQHKRFAVPVCYARVKDDRMESVDEPHGPSQMESRKILFEEEEERVEECACMDLLREMFENPIVVAAVADASPKDFERAKSLLGHHD